ncbi:hypothetical protein SmJEL517_g05215 [Synchytrium microbalum]|uniref:Uncharacterized protein n=1 Tax=Synchytrium microbalum TaxID=1806994 RepID=A0A507C1S9_9FUNG|nr:hypothetical protein SmJEL517_g05215 [Synchytrium microbalum]
MVLSLEPLLLD